jgi:hypothetical protein
MHTVEEESRFAIQPVYPDRQAAFCVEERSTKENSLLFIYNNLYNAKEQMIGNNTKQLDIT